MPLRKNSRSGPGSSARVRWGSSGSSRGGGSAGRADMLPMLTRDRAPALAVRGGPCGAGERGRVRGPSGGSRLFFLGRRSSLPGCPGWPERIIRHQHPALEYQSLSKIPGPSAVAAVSQAAKSGKARKLERPSAELGPHGTQTALKKALFDFAGRQGHRGVKFSGRLARVAKPAQVVRQGSVP